MKQEINESEKFLTEEEIIESCGSKYVSSHLGDSFQRIKQHLQNGNKVLFVGTPCQCAGLLSYVGKERKNLWHLIVKLHQ